MEALKLSEKYTIYKFRYDLTYSIAEYLKLVKANHDITIHTNNNSVWIEIESPLVDSINEQVMSVIKSITGVPFIHYAKHNWVYTQRKGFNMEWMHQHIFVHPPGRSKIHSDYTYTFYLQTTKEIEGEQGKIVFEDETGKKHSYLPEVGDIFLFPADLRHTAIPTPNSYTERIVFAGSFCIDIYNQKTYAKNSI